MTSKPTILTIFGATGDLMTKKLIPSLYLLYKEKKLPKDMEVIGFSRRAYSLKDFRKHVQEIVEHFDKDAKNLNSFLNIFNFVSSQFDDSEGYIKLQEVIKKSKFRNPNLLFYLSVAPSFYGTIVNNLGKIKSGKNSWRVLVEKPIGTNEKEASEIDKTLTKSFLEEQIFRIDHYLQKKIVRNIFAFRFLNRLFENSWNNKNIEKIEVSTTEDLGVEHRGSFYDPLGALKDVGQNHVLNLLALTTMEEPKDFKAESIMQERAKLLSKLPSMTKNQISSNTYRSQYKGYRKIENVDPKSETETYFKIKTSLNSERWKGVPLYLEAGKRIGEPKKEVVVTFKKVQKDIPENFRINNVPNKVKFTAFGDVGIAVDFNLFNESKDEDFVAFVKEGKSTKQYVNEYMQVLLEAIEGDRTWFLSHDEVLASWKFVDPIIAGWKKNLVKLNSYEPNSEKI